MLSDEALLGRIRERDAGAFETFFARHRERVQRHLWMMVRDADSTEDLLQETFLRVWQRAEQWDGRGACAAWLLRIATNLALNQLRAQRRRRELPLELPPAAHDEDDDPRVPGWMIDNASPGPEARCEQAERQARLRQLVRALPEEQRRVIHMVHGAEMEIRDVAAALGIPEGTVKSRLHYARKHLAREWREREDE